MTSMLAALISLALSGLPFAQDDAAGEVQSVADETAAVLIEARAALERANAAQAAGDRATTHSEVELVVELLAPLPLGEGQDETAEILWAVGNPALNSGHFAVVREAWGRVIVHLERTLPEDHPRLLTVRETLAHSMSASGDVAGARALQEAVLAGFERTLPEDHPHLLSARKNLANSMQAMGDVAGARALFEAVLAGYERTLPEGHPQLLAARAGLAASMYLMGDLAGARSLQEAVLVEYERTLPEDHPDLILARMNLANSLHTMGDLAGARALEEAVLEARERTLPEDHPDLLSARMNLAASMHVMGDLVGARTLQEAVLAGFERTLPEDHRHLLAARTNLASLMLMMGDLAGARALQEAILAGFERTLLGDHPDLLAARANLAVSMDAMGDLAGARALREAVLAVYKRTLPDDHPSVLSARANLAGSMSQMGDFAGARALQEAVLEAQERTLPEDHPDLLATRVNLAASMGAMGDLDDARALQEAVLAEYERTLPADHPKLLIVRSILAAFMGAMGDEADARALREAVLAGYERTLPEDHPDLLRARASLAFSMLATGDLADGRALWKAVLAGYERTLPEDHSDLLAARGFLALTMYEMGDLAGARTLLPPLCAGMRGRVLASLTLSPREARQTVASESRRLAQVLSLSEAAEPVLRGTVFELTETMRLVSGEAARSLARFTTDAELAPILEEAASVRRTLNDLIAGAARSKLDAETLSKELARLSLERDRLERDASRRLAERGVVTRPIEIEALAGALDVGEVAVGYRRLPKLYRSELSGRTIQSEDHLFAQILRADESIARFDLGSADELEQLATAWRETLGAPLLRGFKSADEGVDPEVDAGVRLRERILDPILAAVGKDVERLFVCADDLIFLVPLEALPVDKAGSERVGDRVRIVNDVSFARLLATESPVTSKLSLLALGGVDYDAQGAAPDGVVSNTAPIDDADIEELDEDAAVDASTTRGTRSSMPVRFRALRNTRYEAEDTAEMFAEAFEIEPTVLTEDKTTKAALFKAASGKRFVHLATHGWFAPEIVKSTEDAQPTSRSFATMTAEERITGFAPMTLCGLAFAGANRGRNSLGRVPGILTAEELCSLDLSQCELAVLSACETNVGIRRAGQGIQSLQAALYAAGARTSITSLWKVDDRATRTLMEIFYSNLWLEKMPKAEALWQAKRALRDEGHAPRDWAGWILTGNPD